MANEITIRGTCRWHNGTNGAKTIYIPQREARKIHIETNTDYAFEYDTHTKQLTVGEIRLKKSINEDEK